MTGLSVTGDSVPDGWSQTTLRDVCAIIVDGTHHTPSYVARGVPFYSVESITRDDFTNVKYITGVEHRRLIRRCRPQRGDILMTRIGSLADTKLIDWDVDASIYVSLALLRPGPSIDRNYLYAYTKSRRFVRDVEDRSLLWAIPKKINMGDIGSVPVIYPVAVAEQRRIAEAVMDAYDARRTLRRLLFKKQAIAQGMMQELLTGRTRLPGFEDPWRTTTLGEVANIKTGSRNNQDKQASGRYPFFVRSATVERIDSYSYDCEAILVPGEGGVGSIFHYINGRFEVHQRVYKISDFRTSIAGKFIFYFMRQFFGPHAMENSVKATVDSLRLPTFTGFRVEVPVDSREQAAIVKALDDANREVDLVAARLLKSSDVAQGMMQELLSGRTRLIPESAP